MNYNDLFGDRSHIGKLFILKITSLFVYCTSGELDLENILEGEFPLVWIKGEISNFKVYGSGHIYFTLKDEGAQLSSVIWRADAERLKFVPEDGSKVLAHGRLSVYEPRGAYQFLVDKNGASYYDQHVFSDYAHMDMFIGRNAAADIFPHLLDRLERHPQHKN